MAFDPSSTSKLKDISKVISGLLNKPEFLKSKSNQQQLLRALKQFEAEADPIMDTLSVALEQPRDQIGFADFLSDIGNSVVNTQRQLDEQSRVYLEETRPSKHVTPAIYRIPKVSASIKFGLRSTKKEGFNIIVAQKSQEDERMLNQSLDFEIISVPPPPDFHQTLSNQIPSIGFLFATASREVLFKDVEGYKARPDQPGLNKDLLLADKNKVLILPISPRMKPNMDDYLFLAADNAADKNVGIWYLQRDPSNQKPPVFEIILKFSANDRKGENYKILRDIILAHSQQQDQLLS